jgi:hypothetical protein
MLALLLMPPLLSGDATPATVGVALRGTAAVRRDVPVDPARRWYRAQVRGLPRPELVLPADGLTLRADFFAADKPLDGVSKPLAPEVARLRRDLDANGNGRTGGAAAWHTFGFDLRLPFGEIDRVRVSVELTGATGGAFVADDLALVPIADPGTGPKPPADGPADVSGLVSLGGRWLYRPLPGEPFEPADLTVTVTNAVRLFYRDDRLTNPFAENMSATLRAGFKDRAGKVVTADRPVPDAVVLRFCGTHWEVRTKNLPNHPTGAFPEQRGNPGFIRERADVYRLPLDPQPRAGAVAMDAGNRNRALPMGPVGVAVNGVAFFNPFDIGMVDATDQMDRCCGHPTPDDLYHYHKYPVCVRTPFADAGDRHSPVIGWARDGFPVYGPYEAAGVLAMHQTGRPLNAFNLHHDPERGWHYHATPGRFPYLIGGFWGTVAR